MRLSTEQWYRKGRVARMDGKPKSACPDDTLGAERTAWLAGWGHRDLELRSIGIAAAAFEMSE
jgi:ribosome modulation factor